MMQVLGVHPFLRWKTDLPTANNIRKSPNFVLYNCSWQLTLTCNEKLQKESLKNSNHSVIARQTDEARVSDWSTPNEIEYPYVDWDAPVSSLSETEWQPVSDLLIPCFTESYYADWAVPANDSSTQWKIECPPDDWDAPVSISSTFPNALGNDWGGPQEIKCSDDDWAGTASDRYTLHETRYSASD